MARSRTPYNSSSVGPISGPVYMDNVRDRVKDLWDFSSIQLSAIGGSANAITATCDPPLTAGITTGMKFSLVIAATNTAGATITINGGSAINLRDDTGNALLAGALVAGKIYSIEFDGTNFRVMNTSGVIKINDYQVFTSNGTWNKPSGTPANAIVTVMVWGGGGGGGAGTSGSVSGGGGGGMMPFTCKAGDLSSSVAITIGAGGAIGVAGGTSSFGSYVSSFGGGRGNSANNSFCGATGGGGGGAIQTGAAGGSTTSNGFVMPFAAGGDITAGEASGFTVSSGISPRSAISSTGFYGGGAGGSQEVGTTSAAEGGGRCVWGGGGGSSRLGSGGGISQFGGNGGAAGAAGAAPAGGGGSNAVGARGEIRVFVNG